MAHTDKTKKFSRIFLAYSVPKGDIMKKEVLKITKQVKDGFVAEVTRLYDDGSLRVRMHVDCAKSLYNKSTVDGMPAVMLPTGDVLVADKKSRLRLLVMVCEKLDIAYDGIVNGTPNIKDAPRHSSAQFRWLGCRNIDGTVIK